MIHRTNHPATDLRARAEQVRASNAICPTNARTAPLEQGERLATASRGDSEELRFTWTEYKGKPFLSLRLWTRGTDDQWWPDKTKGIAIRRHELADLAEAVAGALDRAEAFAKSQDGAR